jgi:hypothetical protein
VTLSGEIGDVSIADVSQVIRFGAKSGTLRVTSGDASLTILFERGRIVEAKGSVIPRLPDLLRRERVIDEQTLDRTLAQANQEKRPLYQILEEMKLVGASHQEALVAEAISQAFAWSVALRHGSFEFVIDTPPQAEELDAPCRVSLDCEGVLMRAAQIIDEPGREQDIFAPKLMGAPALLTNDVPDSIGAMDAERLLKLYVASHQLYASLKPPDVLAAIREIVANLVGAETFALLIRDDEKLVYEIALAEGPSHWQSGGTYRGGIETVDRALVEGITSFSAADAVRAAIPLRVQGDTVGALILVKLFGHKDEISEDDKELLQLLGANAAAALHTARAYARADRKIRTLESLVEILKSAARPAPAPSLPGASAAGGSR